MSQSNTPVNVSAVDWKEFSDIVRAAFFTVKRALLTQRPDVARHLVTEEAWQRLRAEVDVLRHDGCVNRQTSLNITEITPGSHDVDGSTETVVAHLMLAGIDCIVERASGRVVSGQSYPSDWRENWTFERNRDPALVAEAQAPRCPNCGAPRTVDADGLCTFCQAVVPGAKTDWLVAAIGVPSMAAVDPAMDRRANRDAGTLVMDALEAQARDRPWTGTDTGGGVAGAAGAGIVEIQGHDPAFNPSDLVVEAREAFLKLEDARNQLRPEGVRPMLGDVLYAREVDRARQVQATGRNEVRAYLDISSVSIVAAGTQAGWDRLVIRVAASSARSVVDLRTGDLVEGSSVTHPWYEDLLFERRDTCTTNPLTGLLAHRCPACAAPAAVAEDGCCDSCGQHVTGGEHDWILVNVEAGQASPGPPTT